MQKTDIQAFKLPILSAAAIGPRKKHRTVHPVSFVRLFSKSEKSSRVSISRQDK
jgi:hypothetical protein